MHAEPVREDGITIHCPVCRATQDRRGTCRRCGADLELFLRASESSRLARRRLERAVVDGDHLAEARLRDYLRWLHG